MFWKTKKARCQLTSGIKEDCVRGEKKLSNRIILGITVSTPGGDQMKNPTE